MQQIKRLLLLELNEFNDEFLREACQKLKLTNLQKIFSLQHCRTTTPDTYESDYLEPWVQWVSFHTGLGSSIHKVKHLGDVPDLKYPQVWETLAKHNITTGVWGCLNAANYTGNNSLFFLPDPWTVSEIATPPKLNRLLELPRYLVTHRAKLSITKLLKPTLKFTLTLLKPSILKEFLIGFPAALKMFIKYKGAEFAGFCFLEYLSSIMFIEHWKKYQPQFGILFINTLAHLQHYYWDKPIETNERMAYGLRLIDKLYGKLLANLGPTDGIAVANALSQVNTTMEKPWVSYCPKDHVKFLRAINLNFTKVEPLMSYDALIFFPNPQACADAYEILAMASVENKPLFLVERYEEQPCKLFYRFQYTDLVTESTIFKIGDHDYNFYKYFKKLIVRTGKHMQNADFYVNATAPVTMPNTNVYQYLLAYFDIKVSDVVEH